MSYLRGPLTKDQIKLLQPAATQPAAPSPAPDAPAAPASTTRPRRHRPPMRLGRPRPPTPAPASAVGAGSTTPVMPAVAAGIGVRWVAAGAPWITDVGGDPAGTVWEPGILATTDLRYDEAKADFVLDQAVSSVLFPLSGGIDPTRAVSITLDAAHLTSSAPPSVSYRFVDVAIGDTKTWKQVERGLVDQLVRGDALDDQRQQGAEALLAAERDPGAVRRPLRDGRHAPQQRRRRPRPRRSRRRRRPSSTTSATRRRTGRRWWPSRPRTASAATGCAPPGTWSAGSSARAARRPPASAGPPIVSPATPTTSASTRPPPG